MKTKKETKKYIIGKIKFHQEEIKRYKKWLKSLSKN